MKIMKIVAFVLLIAYFNSCENSPMENKYAIYLENNSGRSIGCYLALGGSFGILYPDTTLPISNKYVITEIKPRSRYIYDSGLTWEEIYRKLPKDTMSLYIFDTDTLNNVSWEDIRSRNKILKRLDLSLEDLQRMNWTITYP